MKYLLFFTIIFMGCSALKKKPMSLLSPQEASTLINQTLQKTCPTSEGKLKLEFQETQKHFSYSSRLEEKKNEWILGIEIPLKGEEVLVLNWDKKPKLEGTILEQSHDFEEMKILELMTTMFEWIKFTKNKPSEILAVDCQGQSDTENYQGSCKVTTKRKGLSEISFTKKDHVWSFLFKDSKENSVIMKLQNESENGFKFISFIEEKKEGELVHEKGAKIDFSISECL